MIRDQLCNLHRYSVNNVFDKIKDEILLGNFVNMNIPSLKVIRLEYVSGNLDYEKFENHRKFIDMHVVLRGSEKIALKEVEGLLAITAYNEEEDYQLYQGEAKDELVINQNEFIVIFPGEAHVVGGKTEQEEEIHKIVYKIPINEK